MRKPKKEIRLTSYEELLGIDENRNNKTWSQCGQHIVNLRRNQRK